MKASLNVDTSRNTVLNKAETQVSVQHLPPIPCQVLGSEAALLRVPTGEADGVPRET